MDVDAIEAGKIVRVSEEYARQEGLQISLPEDAS